MVIYVLISSANAPLLPEFDTNRATICLGLIYSLLTSEVWSQHAGAIAADPALRQAIVRMLLAYCLPTMAAAVSSELQAGLSASRRGLNMLELLPSVLQHPSLAPGGHERAAEAAATVEQAAALVSSLAAAHERRAAMPGSVYAAALANATALLSVCLQKLTGSRRTGAGGSPEAAPAASQAERTAAGWHVAALLPQLRSAIAAWEGDLRQGISGDPLSPSCILLNLRPALHMMSGLQLGDSSPQQVCAWLAAATAALQLLPCAARLATSAGQPGVSEGVAEWIGSVLWLFVDMLPAQMHQLVGQFQRRQQHSTSVSSQQDLLPSTSSEDATWDELPAQLWALHTSLCRLIAALSAPVAPLCFPGQGQQLTPGKWRLMLTAVSTVLIAFVHSQHCSPRPLASSQPSCALQPDSQ